MSIRVAYEEVKKNVKQAFLNLGLTEEQAETCATIHTQSSADGVESHGLNRIPRFVEYVQKGWINLEGKPQLVGAKGAVENYDGQLGIGITNALFCAERAAELAKEHGIGCVALKNTTHWMRGGTYAWKMAEAGFMGMSWINTESCMPLWGKRRAKRWKQSILYGNSKRGWPYCARYGDEPVCLWKAGCIPSGRKAASLSGRL